MKTGRRIWKNIGSSIWGRIGRKKYDRDRIIDYRCRGEIRIQTDTKRMKTCLEWNPNIKIDRLEKDE